MTQHELKQQFPYDPKFLRRVKSIRIAIVIGALGFGGLILCLLAMGFIATIGKIQNW